MKNELDGKVTFDTLTNNEPVILGKSACYIALYPEISKEYMCMIFRTQFFLWYGATKASQTTIKNLSLKAMRKFPVPLPPIEEQQRIVDRVNKLLAKVDEFEKIENRLTAVKEKFPLDLRAAILQAAMQGKLTDQHLDDISVKLLLDVLQLNEQITDEYSVPDNWVILNLGDICDIKNGFTPKRTVEEYWNPKELPWFTVEDVNSQGHIIYSTKQLISRAALGNSTERIVPADTVLLYCTSATIGNYAIAKIPLTTNQQWNGLVIKSEFTDYILTDYLLCWVKTLREKLIDTGKSTTFPFVSVKKLSTFKIPLPPIEEQQRIVERLDALLPLCTDLVKE